MSKPNIILITTDQQRFDTLGVYGNQDIYTPNLDALASRGVVFKNNYVTCPVCIPARRSLLTGLSPHSHGLATYKDGVYFEPPFTAPSLLKAEGYQTALIGKFHMHPQRKRFGHDHMILSESPSHRPDFEYQKKNDYTDWLQKKVGIDPNAAILNSNGREARPFLLEESFHHSNWVLENSVDYITNHRDPTSPLYLHLSFVAPHPPLNPPQHYWDLHKDIQKKPACGDWQRNIAKESFWPAIDSFMGPFDEREMQLARAGYYGLISHLDHLIGSFINRTFGIGSPLAKEPTWLLFTSDHGEMLGDHNLFRKSVPYEGSVHVPLIISNWNIDKRNGINRDLTCLEDVAATIMDMGGVSLPKNLDGKSLLPFMYDDSGTNKEEVFIELGGFFDYFAYIHKNQKYICYHGSKEEQVFDLEEDPYETKDLSNQSNLLEMLREKMKSYLAKQGREMDLSDYHPLCGKTPAVFS